MIGTRHVGDPVSEPARNTEIARPLSDPPWAPLFVGPVSCEATLVSLFVALMRKLQNSIFGSFGEKCKRFCNLHVFGIRLMPMSFLLSSFPHYWF